MTGCSCLKETLRRAVRLVNFYFNSNAFVSVSAVLL